MSVHPATQSTLWAAIGALADVTVEDLESDDGLRRAVAQLSEKSLLLVTAVSKRRKDREGRT